MLSMLGHAGSHLRPGFSSVRLAAETDANKLSRIPRIRAERGRIQYPALHRLPTRLSAHSRAVDRDVRHRSLLLRGVVATGTLLWTARAPSSGDDRPSHRDHPVADGSRIGLGQVSVACPSKF